MFNEYTSLKNDLTVKPRYSEAQNLTRIGFPQLPEIRRLKLYVLPFTSVSTKRQWGWLGFRIKTVETEKLYLNAVFTDRWGKHYRLEYTQNPEPLEKVIEKACIKGMAGILARQIDKKTARPRGRASH